MECRKVYVDIYISVSKDGKVYPRTLQFENGRQFKIERLLSSCPATSSKVDGGGVRYAVLILGQERYIFNEDGRWFVEAKVV